MNGVEDKSALANFIAKRAEWFSWYDVNDEEPNSIQRQIHLMILSEMSYRVLLNERRNLSTNSPLTVPILSHLLETGYFSTQILSIRRLLDSDSDVLSLKRVLTDIQNHRHLLTREIFVSFDDTPYAPEQGELLVSGLQPHDSPFSQFLRSKQRHETFDLISGTNESNRSRFDRVHPDIFARLENWIQDSGAHRLVSLSHKFIAHAADKKSRKQIQIGNLKFDQIEAIQRTIVRVTAAIFDIILNSGVCGEVVPMISLGSFGTVWDEDVMRESTSRMQSHWDQMADTRNHWPDGLEGDLCT